ncbi:hypothetical protein ACN27G_17275 [Plantactinospora sp. WMMB334]|uniref:hypothetical protein n=1 Tax=Plantactinospora sp. WMMB334 TaxID=3404119 RepID=UPI003B924F45
MTAGAFVVVLDQPRDRRWMRLIDEPYVDSVAEGLSMPPRVVVRLTADVSVERADEIADAFRAQLDGEPVTVEFRPT